MRKYVKRLTLLLAAALLIGSIAGCGASESASVNATSVTESGEAASETTTSKSAERAEAAASAEPWRCRRTPPSRKCLSIRSHTRLQTAPF